MYTRPAAPLPIGGVIDDAIKLFRASFRSCWAISLIGSIIISASSAYLAWRMFGSAVNAGLTGAATTPANLLAMMSSIAGAASGFYLVTTLTSLIIYTALFLQINEVGQGRSPMELGTLLVSSLKRLPGVLVASLVFGIAVIIGCILLLIPGVYLWGKMQFWIASMAADGCGAIEGLGRSWSATTNNWWRTVAILTVAFILLIVLQLVVAFISGAAVGVSSLGASSTNEKVLLVLILPQLIRLVWYVVFLPALPAVMLATYYDLMLRRGGADLAARVESLKPA